MASADDIKPESKGRLNEKIYRNFDVSWCDVPCFDTNSPRAGKNGR
jgi:hypothetical protein